MFQKHGNPAILLTEEIGACVSVREGFGLEMFALQGPFQTVPWFILAAVGTCGNTCKAWDRLIAVRDATPAFLSEGTEAF